MKTTTPLRATAMVVFMSCVFTTAQTNAQDRPVRPTQGRAMIDGTEDPVQMKIVAGGPLKADPAKTCYYEYHTDAPTIALFYKGRDRKDRELHIFGTGLSKIALRVVAPDGTTLHSRFENGGPELSHVVFENPSDGVYNVWVGNCASNNSDAFVVFSEFGPSAHWIELGKRKS